VGAGVFAVVRPQSRDHAALLDAIASAG